VRETALAVGVHPVHLARVFRRHLGCSVAGYVRRLRLERAATLLSLERSPISAVAHSCGFADQSHLTRALRRETGLTPATFRRLAIRRDVASVQDGGGLRG
jgi:AraC family transcriptional regulator